ncbi:MAG TPA: hypothetical protein VMV69_02515 [Pirellulales bacterium]|nr:hypothetical protein [Pirellulales bacterium]
MAAPSPGDEGRDRTMCCIRCGTVVLPAPGSTGTLAGDGGAPSGRRDEADPIPNDVNPLAAFDTWELDEQLRHVERILSGRGFNVPPAATRDERRFDAPRGGAALHAKSESTPGASLRRRKPLIAFMAWTILAVGLAVFTCGAVLTGWSIVEARGDLWNIGLPAALTGLLGLLIGMVLQLDMVWHAHRVLAADLARLERQFGEQTERLSASRTAPLTLASSTWADERGL